jgi:hypothetical protein
MAETYKYSAAETGLKPIAIAVVLTTFSVASLLLAAVSVSSSATVAGAYQITAGGR